MKDQNSYAGPHWIYLDTGAGVPFADLKIRATKKQAVAWCPECQAWRPLLWAHENHETQETPPA